MDETLEAAAARVAALLPPAGRLLFITGAGLSAESGLPTYRGVGGLYADGPVEDGLPIEAVMSGRMFAADPARVWRHLARLVAASQGTACNAGHRAIAALQARFEVWVLTQNVDGFHRAAGSNNVIDIHGDLSRLSCTDRHCTRRQRLADTDLARLPPRCPDCGGVLRPDVVLFGEALPRDKLAGWYAQLDRGFDVTFSVGTSSLFAYVAEPMQAAAAAGRPTVEINPEDTAVSHLAAVRLRHGAAASLAAIARLAVA